MASDRCTVEAIRSPSGSTDSSRKGWPPQVGNGRKAAQKPKACHPVDVRSRRCPLQAPPRFFSPNSSARSGEVAAKPPEGPVRPNSSPRCGEVAAKPPEGPVRPNSSPRSGEVAAKPPEGPVRPNSSPRSGEVAAKPPGACEAQLLPT